MDRTRWFNRRFIPLIVAITLALSIPAFAGKAEYVLVIVLDGLRPDCINAEDTPNLWMLRQQGVFFERHHSVYPSATEVNGAALSTGGYPARNGRVANVEYLPTVDLFQPLEISPDYPIWRLDKDRNGQFLQMPTIAEVVRNAGKRTAIAGTKPVIRIADRSFRPAAQGRQGSILFAGSSDPAALMDGYRERYGPPAPLADPRKHPNAAQDAWTTTILIQEMWRNGIPAFTMLWLSEPDFAQHGAGPGSKVGKAAVRCADDRVGDVLKALDDAKVRDKTDIIVLSDHGFSTIGYTVEVADELKKSGLKTVTTFSAKPVDGEIMVVGLGGSVAFYVVGHQEAAVQQLVDKLQASEYAGVIFTRKGLAGTFTLDQAGIDTKDAPDVFVSLRWWNDTSAGGLPGMIASEGNKRIHNQGNHASLSPYDMHATMIAAGPDFLKGKISDLPSGSVDLAPTVLHLLGIKPPVKMDGRILGEAIVGGPAVAGQPAPHKIEATRRIGDVTWRQYLDSTEFGGSIYYHQGNGGVSVR